MNARERNEWDEFVRRVRADSITKIHESALTICITPPTGPDDIDVRQAVEIGASLLLDKPLVIVAARGCAVMPALRRAATHVIELDHDLDLEAGRRELKSKLDPVLEELGLRSQS